MKIYFEQFKFIALLWRLGIDRGYDSIFIYGVKIVLFISKKKKLQIFSFNQLKRSRKFNS